VVEEAARHELLGVHLLVLAAADDVRVADDGDAEELPRERDREAGEVEQVGT
jgi:hypothetical protein